MAGERLVGGFVGRTSYSKSTILAPIHLKFRRIPLNLMIKMVDEELGSLLSWFRTYIGSMEGSLVGRVALR